MKRFIAMFAATMLVGTVAHAYQVTGQVTDVTDTKIVLVKDKEKFEIARDKGTKGDKNIKKGDRVTVYYDMTANNIESKEAKGKDDKAKDTKAPAKK